MQIDSLRILLVGLGKVGMSYDKDAPENQVLSHLKSILMWEQKTQVKCEIVGIDTRTETKKDFYAIAPNGMWLSSINEAKDFENFDLAIVATPIASIAQDVLDLQKKVEISKFVVEKPAAKSLVELKSIQKMAFYGSQILVAFPRPHLNSSLYIKNLIESYGNSQKWWIKISYGGTILNILSHFLNLVEFWFGEFKYSFHYLDKSSNLNVEFHSEDGRFSILVENYSKINDEKSLIKILGPINILYNKSGREIQVQSNTSTLHEIDTFLNCSSEIEKMVGISDSNYLYWALGSKDMQITKINSKALYETISLSDKVNEN